MHPHFAVCCRLWVKQIRMVACYQVSCVLRKGLRNRFGCERVWYCLRDIWRPFPVRALLH